MINVITLITFNLYIKSGPTLQACSRACAVQATCIGFVFDKHTSSQCAVCDPTKDADIQAANFIGAPVFLLGITVTHTLTFPLACMSRRRTLV